MESRLEVFKELKKTTTTCVGNMTSPCVKQVSQACFHGCCPAPLLSLIDSSTETSSKSQAAAAAAAGSYHLDFVIATASSLYPHIHFTNHESLPSLPESSSNFTRAYPLYIHTHQADQIRAKHYYHLSVSGHVCLDYIGHGLFSYSQLQYHSPSLSFPASSSTPQHSHMDFDISYKSLNFNSHIIHTQESEIGSKIKKRIMEFMNISDEDYTMVFTANQQSAFKIVADSYPFHSNANLLTVYDHKNEAVGLMIESSKRRGARVMSAEFSWPNLQIQSEKLRKKILSNKKKRKKGMFVFPLQSRMSGNRYSYLWMSVARENGWHVLLDACALGAKDMDTLGLSLFKPDFLICSFFRVFGENPSGFGCLFVKKSSASILTNTITAGIVQLIPLPVSNKLVLPGSFSDPLEEKNDKGKQKAASISEIMECSEPKRVECEGLDDADNLGLIVISSRARCLINWLVNALISLKHPNSETHLPVVKIYGPKIKFDRGPALAFNVFDWKGEKIDPPLVQKLADRNNISVDYGFLEHIYLADKNNDEEEEEEEKEKEERSGICVVNVVLGFLTNFEDVYRLWAFLSRFLDADFVEKERWRYKAINQKTVEI